MPANAVLGYTRTLLRIIKEHKPVYMAAAFETGSSFRSQIFEQYKATRTETPAGLSPQFDYCRRITEAMASLTSILRLWRRSITPTASWRR
jgi:DNA polymerase-1